MNAPAFWSSFDTVGFQVMRMLLSLLWQSSILFLAVALLTFLLRRRRASVRHVLWVAALIAAPLLPLLAWTASRTGTPQAQIPVMPTYSAPRELPALPLDVKPLVLPDEAPVSTAADVAPPALTEISEERVSFSPAHYPWALGFLAYAFGAALILALVLVGRLRLAGWARRGQVVTNARVLAKFQAARRQLGLRGDFVVVESKKVHAPMMLGALHPVVLLPSGLTQAFSDAEVETVALHELAHIRRRDPLLFTLVSLVRAVLFFHPLVWWACRQISLLAEQACDDAVLEATGEEVSYAKMLMRLAQNLPRRTLATELAVGIVLSRSAFLRRVEAILSHRRQQIRRLSRLALLATVLGALISLALAAALPLGEKGTRAQAAREAELGWGEAVEGLRCQLEVVQGDLPFGEKPRFRITLTNETDEPIDLIGRAYKTHGQGDYAYTRVSYPCVQLSVETPKGFFRVTYDEEPGARPTAMRTAMRLAAGEAWVFEVPPPDRDVAQGRSEQDEVHASLSALMPGTYTADVVYFVRESEKEKFLPNLTYGDEAGNLAGKMPERLWEGIVRSKPVSFKVLEDDSEQLKILRRVYAGEGIKENLRLQLSASRTTVKPGGGVVLRLTAHNTGDERLYLDSDYGLHENGPRGERSHYGGIRPGSVRSIEAGDSLSLGTSLLGGGEPLVAGTYEVWVEYRTPRPPCHATMGETLARSNIVTIEVHEEEPAWGEAVEGVDFWMWVDKLIWEADEAPQFKADLVHKGKRELPRSGPYELEFDGVWYVESPDAETHTRAFDPQVFHPRHAYRDILFALDASWRSKRSRNRLRLTAGRHRVRLAFNTEPPDKAAKQPTRLVTNVVRFRVLGAGEEPTEEEWFELACGGLPGTKYSPEQVAAMHRGEYGQDLPPSELAVFYAAKAGGLAQSSAEPVLLADTVERALPFEHDALVEAQLYMHLGDAHQRQTWKYSPAIWGRQRRIAAEAYLTGLRRFLRQDIPARPPRRAGVGGRACVVPELAARYPTKEQRQIGSWDAVREVGDLVGMRQALTGCVISMYGRQPAAFDELRTLVLKHIGSDEAADQVVNAAKGERSVPVITTPQHRGAAETDDGAYAAQFMKTYQEEGAATEAGFIPDETEIVLGQTLLISFTAINRSGKAYVFETGGDYRGSGRHNRFRITAADEQGQPVFDPRSNPEMGGIGSIVTLDPGETYLERLDLGLWCAFEKPGLYTVTCKRTLNGDGPPRRHPKMPVVTSFKLTLLPRTEANVQRVISELVQRAVRAQKSALGEAIGEVCSFAGARAVPQLVQMVDEGDVEHRVAALQGLSRFTTDEAVAAVTRAFADPAQSIRTAAAEALGNMKTDAAVGALLDTLPKEEPDVALAILRALGSTRSPRTFNVLVESLAQSNDTRRRAAVEGLTAFGGPEAVKALKGHVNDDDMGFRELVVRKLVEPLKQPLDVQWLIPVIRSRRKANSLGDAPRLLRLYGGERAVPALLSCLDFEDPSVRGFYNRSIIYSQAYCLGGLRIPWISDLNRDGTPEEIEQNRKTLKRIRPWVEHYHKYRMDERPQPRYLGWREENKAWGEPVDGISVRARVNQRVWPEGMPQLISIDVRSHPGEGSVNLSSLPEPLEVEINGEWYSRQPPLEGPTMGVDAGHGSNFHNLQLHEKWRRKSDNRGLQLSPDDYTLRVRLSTTPENRRSGLATSRSVEFEVIPTAWPLADLIHQGIEGLRLELTAVRTTLRAWEATDLGLSIQNTGSRTIYLEGDYGLQERGPRGERGDFSGPRSGRPRLIRPRRSVELATWRFGSGGPLVEGDYQVCMEYRSPKSDQVLARSNTLTIKVLPPRAVPRNPSPRDQAVHEGLKKKVTFQFYDTPFPEAVEFLQTSGNFGIVVDKTGRKRLLAQGEQRVTGLYLKDVSIEAALNSVTEPIGLCFHVEDGVVVLSDADEPQSYSYDVGELLKEKVGAVGFTAEQIIKEIRKALGSEKWEYPRRIEFKAPGALIVLQTCDCHKQIVKLLRSMRHVLVEPKADGAALFPLEPVASEPRGKREGPAWGEAVEGVQVRLRTYENSEEALSYPASLAPHGSVPILVADIRNRGTRRFQVNISGPYEIEVDGEWCYYTGGYWLLDRPPRVEPGSVSEGIAIPLGCWRRKKPPYDEMAERPGRHRVRVGFLLHQTDTDATTKAISNPVEIEILPPAASAEGSFELGKRIPVKVVAGTPEYPKVIETEWIEFEKKDGQVQGELHLKWLSLVKAEWKGTVELLGEHQAALGRAQATFATTALGLEVKPGALYEPWHVETLKFSLGRWGDVSKATRFRVRVEIRVLPPEELPEGLEFGPVVERKLFDAVGKEEFIDFETGKVFPLPEAVPLRGRQFEAWLRINGIDASVDMGDGRPTSGWLKGHDLPYKEVPAKLWDSLTSEQIRQFLAKPNAGLHARIDPGIKQESIYVFRTRIGNIGVLELLEVHTPPPAWIRLRYKMVQPEPQAVSERPVSDSARVEVSGRVTDEQTGKPIERYALQWGSPSVAVFSASGGAHTHSRQLWPEGRFSTGFRWPKAEKIWFRVRAPGYVSQPVTPEPLTPPATVHDLEVVLNRGRQIQGRIMDHRGRPAAGARVFLGDYRRGVSLNDGDDTRHRGPRAITDKGGRFVLAGATEGPAPMVVSAPSLHVWRVEAPELDQEITITLPEPATLVVRYDIEGDNDPGRFRLLLYRRKMKGWKGVTSEQSLTVPNKGEAALKNVTPGVYLLDRIKRVDTWGGTPACDRTAVTLEAGKTTEVEFVRKTGHPITGEVTGLSEAEFDQGVIFVKGPEATLDLRESSSPFFDALTWDAAGRFKTARLLPGSYKVIAWAFKPWRPGGVRGTGGPVPDFAGIAKVTVPKDGEPPHVRIEMNPRG